MQKTLQRRFAVSCIVLAWAAVPAAAQETIRVRGTVERIDGSSYFVKSRGGEDIRLTLGEKPLFVAVVKASMTELKPGMFVGSGARPQPDGSQRALEVHIFPESMRGTGEGHRPWDAVPDATMTNANVEASIAGVEGQVLTMKYPGGEKKLIVTPDTPVVRYDSGGNAGEVKAGASVNIVAIRQPNGTLMIQRVTYGRDGLVLPM
jgi:hypothetical protein